MGRVDGWLVVCLMGADLCWLVCCLNGVVCGYNILLIVLIDVHLSPPALLLIPFLLDVWHHDAAAAAADADVVQRPSSLIRAGGD